jgi:hypothetical protein
MKTVGWKVSHIQKVRGKESLGLMALKRAVMIELCIVVRICSAVLQGVNERFHDFLKMIWSMC